MSGEIAVGLNSLGAISGSMKVFLSAIISCQKGWKSEGTNWSDFKIPSFLTEEIVEGGHVCGIEVGASRRKKNGSDTWAAVGSLACQVLHSVSLADSFVYAPVEVKST